eukprot:9719170-Heterocapsa_arctica.AAC.1
MRTDRSSQTKKRKKNRSGRIGEMVKQRIDKGDNPEVNSHNRRSDTRPKRDHHKVNSTVSIEMPVSDTAETGDINQFYKEGSKQEGGHLPNTGQGQKKHVDQYMIKCANKQRFAYNRRAKYDYICFKLAQSIRHLPTHRKA